MPMERCTFSGLLILLSFFVLFFFLLADLVIADSYEGKNPLRKIELAKEECLDLMKLFKIDPWERNCIERCDSSFYDSSDPNTTQSGKYRSVAWSECKTFHFQCPVLCNGYFVKKACHEWFKSRGLKAEPNSMRCVKDCERYMNKSEEDLIVYNSQVACDPSECMSMCADNAHTVPEECYAWFKPIWNSLAKEDVTELAFECQAKCEEAPKPQTYAYCPSYCEDLCQEFVNPYLMGMKEKEKPSSKAFSELSKPEKSCEEITDPSLWIKFWKFPKWPPNVSKAREYGYRAQEKMKELYPNTKEGDKHCNSWTGGKGDAFKHCYWSCLMAKKLGEKTAGDYGDVQEFRYPNRCEEAKMDYNNNHVGLDVAESGKDCESGCVNSTDLTILEEEDVCK